MLDDVSPIQNSFKKRTGIYTPLSSQSYKMLHQIYNYRREAETLGRGSEEGSEIFRYLSRITIKNMLS
jgi:hypothetical protein